MLKNPRYAFIGQSMSTNTVPFDMLVCYSNFVPKMHRFLRHSTSKMP